MFAPMYLRVCQYSRYWVSTPRVAYQVWTHGHCGVGPSAISTKTFHAGFFSHSKNCLRTNLLRATPLLERSHLHTIFSFGVFPANRDRCAPSPLRKSPTCNGRSVPPPSQAEVLASKRHAPSPQSSFSTLISLMKEGTLTIALDTFEFVS